MATRLLFTDSQWEELEHQALIYKYIVAGIPVPPDLLFRIRRNPFFSSSSSTPSSASKLFSHAAPPHFAWNMYEMGMGRKIDPEPGRCRRTDGKKWRCSKEAYPDSKYCERHMHRGKNRSRKPVEFSSSSSSSSSSNTITIPSSNSVSSSSTLSSSSSALFLNSSSNNNNLRDADFNLSAFSLNSTSSLSRPINGLTLSSSLHDHHSSRLFLDSAFGSAYSFAADNDSRGRGRRRSVYMDDFFSVEPSGTIRGFPTMEDCSSWGYTPLTVNNNTTSSYSPKQRMIQNDKPDRHCFILGADVATTQESPLMMFGKKMKHAENEEEEEEEERKRRVHRFLDEWPSSNTSSVSTSLFI